ncbi:hypothetical protein Xsto_03001 [Xenorhabdus stockiae]|uniref:Apea-like HEPN domain-containing protein n=1 Tax=Xenorhabdus stockiae TaxID=351614 RepID=A0A2D0KM35_9GAMM|nr:hypothetical protein [Xenorhabdus stockiae]PHM64466.1 hypothetical protein Xsto_03001 [Xenorhabdus stockiae]
MSKNKKKPNKDQEELLNNFNNSANLTLSLLLSLYLIEILRKPKLNEFTIKKSLSEHPSVLGEIYNEHFDVLYQENVKSVLEKNDLKSDFISELIEKIDGDNFKYDESILNDVLNALEIDIKDEYKNKITTCCNIHDGITNILGNILDFLDEYQETMFETLELIESVNSKNKEKVLYMTYSFFVRTLVSYVEECKKDLTKEIVNLSHIKLIRLISSKHNINTDKEIHSEVKKISKQGFGSLIEFLKEYVDFSLKKSPEIYNKYKKEINTIKKFTEYRNIITHNFKPNNEDFKFIIDNWRLCLNFYSDIILEYTIRDGFNIFYNTLFDEAKECAKDEHLMLERVIPLARSHL